MTEFEIEFEFTPFGSSKIDNPYLEYTIYRLLNKFDLRFMSKIRFYKILYLIYRFLRRRNIDIQLPYIWYKQGVVVNEIVLPVNIQYDFDGIKHTPKTISKPEGKIDEDKKNVIDETIKFIQEIYETKTTEELVDEVYCFAPLDFQKVFREFKKDLDKNNIEGAYRNITLLFEKFPKKEFPELYPVFLRIIPLLRHGFENKRFIEELKTLIEEFWNVFCEKLAMLHNGNIPFDLSAIFDKRYKEGLAELRKRVKEVENLILDDLPDSDSEFQASFEKHLEKFLESKGYL